MQVHWLTSERVSQMLKACACCHSAGQFGTRLQGGKDSASARYIFTRMTKLTRHLFNAFDDRLLNYLNEEGQQIEPEWY